MSEELLVGADVVFKNKKGQVVFATKVKKDSNGGHYIIFERHDELIPIEARVEFIQRMELMKDVFKELKIPLFDAEEISIKGKQKLDELIISPGETVDINIFLTNHSTGEVVKFTVGITNMEGKK